MKIRISKLHWPTIFLRVLVTVLIFSAIIWLLPMKEVWNAMRAVGWWRWILVLCIFGIAHTVAAWKWCQLVRATETTLDFAIAVRAHMAGLFANIWLPSIVGGDVVRAAWISRRQGIAVPAVTGLLDRALDLLALIILVAIGALLLGDAGGEFTVGVLRNIVVLLVLGIFLALIALRWLKVEHLPQALHALYTKIAGIVQALYARPAPALRSLLLALLVQFTLVGLNYFLGNAMGIAVPFAVWLVAWPLAKIVALLPVSLGGLGVREVALATLLAPFAVPATMAVAQALVWQSVLFGFGLLAGAAILFSGYRPSESEPS